LGEGLIDEGQGVGLEGLDVGLLLGLWLGRGEGVGLREGLIDEGRGVGLEGLDVGLLLGWWLGDRIGCRVGSPRG